MAVIDLGAAPGGWSQIAAKRVGALDGKGGVVAIDVIEMGELPGVEFVRSDSSTPDAPAQLREMLGGGADVVMSDMAANTTGHRKTDQLRMVGLVEAAAEFACEVLKPGGAFWPKVQSGADAELLVQLKRISRPFVMSSQLRAGRILRNVICWRRDFGRLSRGGANEGDDVGWQRRDARCPRRSSTVAGRFRFAATLDSEFSGVLS